jgi:hypothetical protein
MDMRGMDKSMLIAKYKSIKEPTIEMAVITPGLWMKCAKPKIINPTIKASNMAWPKLINGPDLAPLLALSAITAVNKGPGISAPEKAMINEITNIER